MNKIISDFKIKQGIHCLFSSMANVAAYYKYNISEADIYFISDGLNVQYNTTTNAIGSPLDYLVKYFADSISINCKAYFSMNDDEPLNEIYEAVGNGYPVLAFANSKYLNYSEIYTQGDNHKHVIIIYGVNHDENILYVADSFLLDHSGDVLTYTGPVSLSKLKPGLFGYAILDFCCASSIDENFIIKKAIYNINNFLNSYSDNKDCISGISAYKCFFKDLLLEKHYENDKFTQAFKRHYYNLRIGTIMHFNDYLKDFIKCYMLNRDRVFYDILGSIEEIYFEWKLSMLNLYKIGVTKKKENVDNVVKKCNQLISKQEEIGYQILKNAKILNK